MRNSELRLALFDTSRPVLDGLMMNPVGKQGDRETQSEEGIVNYTLDSHDWTPEIESEKKSESNSRVYLGH